MRLRGLPVVAGMSMQLNVESRFEIYDPSRVAQRAACPCPRRRGPGSGGRACGAAGAGRRAPARRCLLPCWRELPVRREGASL